MTVSTNMATLGTPVTQTAVAAEAIDPSNLVALNAAGLLVPAGSGAAVTFLGWSESGGAIGDDIKFARGYVGFENDVAAPVAQADVGLAGKVGNDGTSITFSPAAGTGLVAGMITSIDAEGLVWVDTRTVL